MSAMSDLSQPTRPFQANSIVEHTVARMGRIYGRSDSNASLAPRHSRSDFGILFTLQAEWILFSVADALEVGLGAIEFPTGANVEQW